MAVRWSIQPTTEAQKEQYRALAAEYGKKYGVPYQVVVGVIQQESKFDPNSYRWNEENPADRSFGLMHLTVPTAQEVANKIWGVGTVAIDQNFLYNPRNNVQLGTYYLKQQYNKYGQNWTNAVSAYNAGKPIQSNMLTYVANVFQKGAQIPMAKTAAVASVILGSMIAWVLYNKYYRVTT